MTNQEIFDDLGEMGTLMLLFIEMAGSDGEVTEDEIETLCESGSNFTDKDLSPFIDSALKVRSTLGTEERIAYLAAGLDLFAGKFPADMKKGILIELAKIAKADGAIHDNESELFKMAASYLNA
jgi:uncharacterized tellurite resistance protein B-like protein